MKERDLMPKVGDTAPDFELPTAEGKKIRLSDFRGKRVVLYFYPKDNTPGCTKEACSFRDNLSLLKRKGVVVLGVSPDSVQSHATFAKKYNLPFPLLSDPSKKVLQAYGVWKKKQMFGVKYMGVERTTFLIDEEGKIAHIFPNVRVDGHTQEVLEKV